MLLLVQSGLAVGSGILLASILAIPGVVATASPQPLPAPYYAPDYSARFIPHHSTPIVHHNKLVKRLVDSSKTHVTPSAKTAYSPGAHTPIHRPAFKRVLSSFKKHVFSRDVVNDFEDLLNGFSNGRSDAQDNASALKALADQSSVSGDGNGFQQNAATQAIALHSLFQNLDVLLKQSGGGDKGLANYDGSSKLETLIKDIINANKNALTSINLMIYNIPGLGPVLGPIVYEIKCIIDDILNSIENLTDGLPNALGPGFTGLLGQANAINCSNNVKLLGFCV